MRLEIHQEFKHDKVHYFVGERVEVDDALAAVFIGNGWAARMGQAPNQVDQPKTVTLDIHNGTIDLSSVFDQIDRGLQLKAGD